MTTDYYIFYFVYPTRTAKSVYFVLETGATDRRLLRLSRPPSAPTLQVGIGSDRATAPDINRSCQGSRGGSPNASRERQKAKRDPEKRIAKIESGKSWSNAVVPGVGIASQVKVVQKQQCQRAHSDAGGQSEVIWPKKEVELRGGCDNASRGMQNRRLAGALPGTEVGIAPTIRNSCSNNKKIGSRVRRSARSKLGQWIDQPPTMKEITDTSRRTRSRSRSFSTETRTTHKVEVLDSSALPLRLGHVVFVGARSNT